MGSLRTGERHLCPWRPVDLILSAPLPASRCAGLDQRAGGPLGPVHWASGLRGEPAGERCARRPACPGRELRPQHTGLGPADPHAEHPGGCHWCPRSVPLLLLFPSCRLRECGGFFWDLSPGIAMSPHLQGVPVHHQAPGTGVLGTHSAWHRGNATGPVLSSQLCLCRGASCLPVPQCGFLT